MSKSKTEIEQDEEDRKKAVAIIEEGMSEPVHLRVPVTKERAMRWLAQRNLLGRFMEEQSEHEEELLRELSEDVVSIRNELDDLEARMKEALKERRGALMFHVAHELLDKMYGEEGYSPLWEDLDPSWHERKKDR